MDDDSLTLFVDRSSRNHKKSHFIGLEEKGGTLYESAYAYVYKNNYKINSEDENTFLSELIAKIKQNSISFREDHLTFENGLTHITSTMQANVDYIL